jgi:hypothetical protein
MTKAMLMILFPMTVFFGTMTNVSAQSNEILDALLEENPASYGKTAYLVLSAADIVPETGDAARAVSEVNDRGWNRFGKGANDPVKLGEFAYMTMQAFGIKGGLMYTLFPSPRYAAREFGFKGYVKDRPGPYRYISGKETVLVLGRVMRDVGGEQ